MKTEEGGTLIRANWGVSQKNLGDLQEARSAERRPHVYSSLAPGGDVWLGLASYARLTQRLVTVQGIVSHRHKKKKEGGN